MPRLTAAQLKDHENMKPIAECVTSYPIRCVVYTIAHYECNELTAQIDDNPIGLYKICGDERPYFTAYGRRYYLDEIIRYDSSWMRRML